MTSPAVLISPAELTTLMNSEPVVLIDTRDADTYAAGHIPGAVNLREVFTYLATSSVEGLNELKSTFTTALGAVGLSGAETAPDTLVKGSKLSFTSRIVWSFIAVPPSGA